MTILDAPVLALKAGALLLLGLAYARTAGRHRPAAANLAIRLAFGAVLLLPLAAALLPAWGVPLMSHPAPATRAVPLGRRATARRLPRTLPDGPGPLIAWRDSRPVTAAPDDPSSVVGIMFSVWMLGAFAVLTRVAVGGLGLLRLARRSVPLVIPQGLAARSSLRRTLSLRRSLPGGPDGALTWGTIRPLVLLPAESADWPPERLESVLLHEFAHARRADALAGLVAELACAVHWFNPLAWLAARELRTTAEGAADRAVVSGGVPAAAYAAELLRLAAEIRRPSRLALPGVQAMNTPKLESRLRAVLAAEAPALSFRHAAAAGIVLLVAFPAVAAFRPVPRQEVAVGGPDRAEALRRMKLLGAATLMYAQDYDDVFPSAGATRPAAAQVLPYAKATARRLLPGRTDAQLFRSPTPGGSFFFNTLLSRVSLDRIESPAEVVAWYETLPDMEALVAVAYVDGHARFLTASRAMRQMRVGTASPPRRNPGVAVPAARVAVVVQAKIARIEAQQVELERMARVLGPTPRQARANQLERKRLRGWLDALRAELRTARG